MRTISPVRRVSSLVVALDDMVVVLFMAQPNLPVM
jgi:hypothetical protein